MRNLVLVGGGHSQVAVLKSFGMNPLPGVRLTLVCRDSHTPYSGMLPGLIAGHYTFDDVHIDLRRLAAFAGARFIKDDVIGIDRLAKHVLCRSRDPIPYDVCSLNIGSAPNTVDVPGAAAYAVPVKPISRFINHWQELKEKVGNTPGTYRIGVVGAGAGGTELILAAHHGLSNLLQDLNKPPESVKLTLITATAEIVPTHNKAVMRRLNRCLKSKGIDVRVGRRVIDVDKSKVRFDDGTTAELDTLLWTAQAAAPAWLEETGLELTQDGFIQVRDTLQSVTDDFIFAAGDIATMVNHPREKAGVMAVRQGPPLTRNLRRILTDQAPKPFRPQAKWLSLISTGEKSAVASWYGLSAAGPLVWRWKDWIDRRFMDRFNTLPDMTPGHNTNAANHGGDPDSLDDLMRCAGCGGKIGSPILMRVFDRLRAETELAEAFSVELDDGAVSVPPAHRSLVQSVDFFRAFIDDPYLFGCIAANHALTDIYAMGAKPHSALAIALLPALPDAVLEEDLFLLLKGALTICHRAHTQLVGGHSGEGQETALGFAVSGYGEADLLLRKSGLKPGDALILTKPLGTGTLLAAHMRLKAKGRWIDTALEMMCQSADRAAEIFLEANASACTDVTGFGLAGHVLEMARASQVQCQIDLDTLPPLDGAMETIQAGILSTLHAQNIAGVQPYLKMDETAKRHALYPLLFDPQTAGGLIAGVPETHSERCVRRLRRAGYGAARIIGRVAERGLPGITLRGS